MPQTLTTPWANYQRLPDQPAEFPLQQNRPCPGCQSDNEIELMSIDRFQCFEDRDGNNRIDVRAVFCRDCGWVFSNPWLTPRAIPFLFDRAGWSYGHCNPKERVAWILDRVPQAGSILDVGCGDGSLLSAFPNDYQCAGVDIDSRAIERGKKQFPDIQFFLADFTNWEWPREAQVITLFHLLEHVPEPLALLKRLGKSASPETRLVVEVPVLDRAIECQGPDLCGFFSIPHRTHFSRATLHCVLQKAGWRVIQSHDLDGNGYRVLAERGDCNLSEVIVDVAEQLRLARDYCRVHESSIEVVKQKIEALDADSYVLIWGAGHHTEFLNCLTSLFNEGRKFCVVDCDPGKTGTTLHGIPVMHPDSFSNEFWKDEKFKVLVSSYAWQEAISKDLIGRGVAPERILTLYPSRF